MKKEDTSFIDDLFDALSRTQGGVSTPVLEEIDKISKKMVQMKEENERLKAGRFTEAEFQGLCHTFDENDVCRFKAGCDHYQKKLFGEKANFPIGYRQLLSEETIEEGDFLYGSLGPGETPGIHKAWTIGHKVKDVIPCHNIFGHVYYRKVSDKDVVVLEDDDIRWDIRSSVVENGGEKVIELSWGWTAGMTEEQISRLDESEQIASSKVLINQLQALELIADLSKLVLGFVAEDFNKAYEARVAARMKEIECTQQKT
jgi:hypothetical protein